MTSGSSLDLLTQTLLVDRSYLIGSRSTIPTRVATRPKSTTLARWQGGDRVSYQSGSREFEVENVLVGGMGVVYIVTDVRNGDPFVVKAMREQYSAHPLLRARFQREAEAWIALEKHPNIVQARGFEYLEDEPHIFLEYVSGGSLGTLLRHTELPLLDVLQLAVQICRGMRHASSMGITAHRDLKPDNIMLTAEQSAKVTDFGLVKLWDDAPIEESDDLDLLAGSGPFISPMLTQVDAPGFGTKEYMPPEQWRSARETDIRSDVYAFGVMLYEMLTGIRPFYGKTRDELRDRHFNYQPVAPSALRPDIPPSVDQIVQRCLQKAPDARYSDFTPLHHDLTRILQQEFRQVVPLLNKAEMTIAEVNERGAALFNLGKHKQALVCFQEVLKHAPAHAVAWANRSVTLAELNRYDEALVSFDQALAINPDNAIVLTNKGLTLLELGRYEDALTCFERAVRLDRFLQNAWRYRSQVLNHLGWYETAYYSALRARQLDSSDEQAHYHEAFALAKLGQIQAAVDAAAHYEYLVGLRAPSAIFLRALIASAQGEWRDCLLLCATIERDAPEYRMALLLGMESALMLGNLDEVETLLAMMPPEEYDKALDLMLPVLDGHEALGGRFLALACDTAVQAGDLVAARFLYEAWMAQHRNGQGEALGRVEFQFPLDILETFDPADSRQRIAQGMLYMYLGEYQGAARHLREGLRNASGDACAWLCLGRACIQVEDYAGALAAYEHASRLLPGDGAIWLEFAAAAVQEEDYSIALSAIRRAQTLLGDSPVVALVHGAAQFGLGQYHPAIRQFDRALQTMPGMALAWWNRGLCLAQVGRRLEAQRAVHRARALDVRLWRKPDYLKRPLLLYPLVADSVSLL